MAEELDILPLAKTCTWIRLKEEMLQWRVNHPSGFYARPAMTVKEEIPVSLKVTFSCVPSEINERVHYYDLRTWHCGIPGKSDTKLREYYFDLTLFFDIDYPKEPPKIEFKHPALNRISALKDVLECSYLQAGQGWEPSLTIERMLCGIQDILHRLKFMNPPGQSFGLYARHISAPLPFYPFTDGWYSAGPGRYLMTGQHSIIPKLDDEQ